MVGNRRFPVNTVYLSAFSPVFAAMFGNDMAEKKATEVEIKDVEPGDFSDFLASFSPQPILPNRLFFSYSLQIIKYLLTFSVKCEGSIEAR